MDTNILVYAHDRSAGKKYTQAKALLQTLWDTQQGCLSVQVLQEFYVAVTQKVATPMEGSTAARVIQDLATWQVHGPQAQDVWAAIDLHQRYQVSFWDAMILQSAGQLGCAIVWSEDLNPGQIYAGVRMANPFRPFKINPDAVAEILSSSCRTMRR